MNRFTKLFHNKTLEEAFYVQHRLPFNLHYLVKVEDLKMSPILVPSTLLPCYRLTVDKVKHLHVTCSMFMLLHYIVEFYDPDFSLRLS